MKNKTDEKEPAGDGDSFDKNWLSQPEANYLHWTRGEPANQIQFAFRQHWKSFQPFLQQVTGRRCLEVGCGRGSMSAYFADAGWDCSLLDISPKAIELAQQSFTQQGLTAQFDVGDCLSLPYADASFDVCLSIGLLEHFREFNQVIREQVRVLAKGGLLISYIVPHIPNNVQTQFEWICDLLKSLSPAQLNTTKTPVYRSDAMSSRYLKSMQQAGLSDLFASGIYSLPMISHSTDFPFTLMPEAAEQTLVQQFSRMLEQRKINEDISDPWLCDEHYGQAILVCGYKR